MSIEDYGHRVKPAGILYVDVFPYHVPVGAEPRFLLLRRRLDVVMPGVWQAVSGKIAAEERIRRAFVRQVQRKTGQVPRELFKLDTVTIFYDDYYDTVMMVPVAACRIEPTPIEIDPKLHTEHRWATLDEARELVEWPRQVECMRMVADVLTGRSPRSPLQALPIDDGADSRS
ncbi:MAG: NUDIX domain-containing protein [Deltaproteobacteria bacterium]|nr:NUDIX domain-containing protein [Deltaproteobacteria bacterium]